MAQDWIELAAENRDSLRLPELAPGVENSALVQSYFHFYGLDFEAEFEGLRHELGVFQSAGFEIVGQVFIPQSASATVYLYHGFYDHVGLYKHAIRYCLQQGYAVFAYDLPGHGLSTGARSEINSFDQYLAVMQDAFMVAAQFDLPARKIALAQSTGGAVVMTYLLKGGDAFERVVLLAPLLRPDGWWWGRPLHGVIGGMIKSLPRKWIANSSDKDFLEFVRHGDILQCQVLPMSWVGALKQWETTFYELPQCHQPILVVQGDQDRTVDWRYNLPRIRDHFPNATLSYINGAHHQLVNETEHLRDMIWQRVTNFIAG